MWGESAIVVGSPESLYRVGDEEIEFFLDHPATAEERDWKEIKKQAGLPTC